LLHAVVAGAIDFQHVERSAFGDLDATRISVVELHLGPSVQLRHLAKMRAMVVLPVPRAAKQVGVGDAVLLDGVGERLRDVFLAHDVAEPLRPYFGR